VEHNEPFYWVYLRDPGLESWSGDLLSLGICGFFSLPYKRCTIILPVVLYGCETWSFALRKVHILKVYENIWSWDEANGGRLVTLFSEELHNLYASLNIIRVVRSRRMSWAGHVARVGEMRSMYNIWWRRWEDNIRMDLREIVWEFVHCIHLVQDRDQWWAVVNTVMSLRVP
jgi:hypothetical protein